MWQPPGPPLDAAAAAAAAQAAAQAQAAQQVREGGREGTVCWSLDPLVCTPCAGPGIGDCYSRRRRGAGARKPTVAHPPFPLPQAAALQAASAPPHLTPTATEAAAALAAAAGAAARAAQLHALMAANPAVAADPQSLAELRQLQVGIRRRGARVEWTDHAEREK